MKAWMRVVINALILAGISFFSTLSAELTINGHITWMTVAAGGISFAIIFLTKVNDLVDDDGKNDVEIEGNPVPKATVENSPPQKKGKIIKLWV